MRLRLVKNDHISKHHQPPLNVFRRAGMPGLGVPDDDFAFFPFGDDARVPPILFVAEGQGFVGSSLVGAFPLFTSRNSPSVLLCKLLQSVSGLAGLFLECLAVAHRTICGL